MTARQKVSKEELKKSFKDYISKKEAFLKEVAEGADFYETAKKYGKKFVTPIQIPNKK